MSNDFELPRGWASIPLGKVGKWYGGGTPSKFNSDFWSNGTTPWISPKDMKSLRLSDSEDHISKSALDQTNVKPFPAGTVLVVIRSGILSRTLPVAVAEVEATMNQDLKGVLPHDAVDSTYLAYFLRAEERSILRQCSKHGTTVASIDTTALHSFQARVAPLSEQRRIVAKIEELFSDLDAGVSALERAKANLKRYRAAVLKAAVEGDLTEQWRADHPNTEPASKLLARILTERRKKWDSDQLAKFAAAKKEPPKNWKEKYVEPSLPNTTDLPEVPNGWCWTRIGQLVAESPQNGAYYPKAMYGSGDAIVRIDDYQQFWNRGVTDLQRVRVSGADRNVYGLVENDLLINRVNSMTHLGKVLLVEQRHLPAIFESNIMRLRVCDRTLASYLREYLRSADGAKRLMENAKWAVNQASINQQDVQATQVPLPPCDEQAQIATQVAEKLSQIEVAATAIHHGLLRAARLRQSILKQAFAGKLVPQDPQDEPASALLECIRSENGKMKSGAPPKHRTRKATDSKKEMPLVPGRARR